MSMLQRIGLGGGCHWCTEAIFQHIKGVDKVQQGYISSKGTASSFSEAIIVHFDSRLISMRQLLQVHLHTHHATSDHSFRDKYRSAVYWFDRNDIQDIKNSLLTLQQDFDKALQTQVLPFKNFRASRESIQNYYRKNPDAPFCVRYIEPKLDLVNQLFGQVIKKRSF